MLRTKTYTTKPSGVTPKWYLMDAATAPLGRLCALAATRLIGKHKVGYDAHINVGDNVIIINASKVVLTGKKTEQTKYYRHSGYPGNLKTMTAGESIAKNPAAMIENTIKGMLPKNKLQAVRLKKLYVYPGLEHPHVAQQPQPLEVKS